jgi:tetratricopeptide (TPR) repeat protein
MFHRVNLIIAVGALVVAGVITGSAAADDSVTCEKGSGDVAIAACTRRIQSGKVAGYDLAVNYVNRGANYSIKGDLDAAMADYNEAIRLSPNFSNAFTHRGNLYADKGNLDLALSDYNEAIRLEPNAISFLDRGNLYSGKGDFDSAIADYNEAVRLNPKYAKAFYNRGITKRSKGDVAGGDADIAEAVAIQPGIGQ